MERMRSATRQPLSEIADRKCDERERRNATSEGRKGAVGARSERWSWYL
jgi:hypothetical protein